MIKKYEPRSLENELRGRIKVSESVRRHFARGVPYRHTFDVVDLATDLWENRIVRATSKVLRSMEASSPANRNDREQSLRNTLLNLAGAREGGVDDLAIVSRVPALIRGLPRHMSHSEAPSWLAYLLAGRNGFSLEEFGSLTLDSILVNVSGVFERYVQDLLIEAARKWDMTAVNNKDSPVKLFNRGAGNDVTPYLYFDSGGRTVMVADAKVKPKIEKEDRCEVLAHCDATRSKHAVFLCPR